MKTANITFRECIQNTQDIGTDDEHMASRVRFSIEIDGKSKEFSILVKQTAGSNYETDPLEVAPIDGLPELVDYHAFREAVEKYYRACFGQNAAFLAVESGTVIMRNNTVRLNMGPIPFEIRQSSAGW